MNIKIPPIEIEIDDERKYALVAFFVDRDDFLEDINAARKDLGLSDFIPYDEVEEWENQQLESLKKIDPPKLINTGKGIAYWDPETVIEKIIFELLKKYNKSSIYFDVVSKAILSGKVKDDAFTKTAYCYVHYPDFYNPKDYGLEIIEEPKICIVITPDTNPEEIDELFNKEVPEAIKNYQDYLNSHPNYTWSKTSNIRRDRRWYWLNHKINSYDIEKRVILSNKLGYLKIAQLEDVYVSWTGVREAINQYKKRLSSETLVHS